MQYYKQLYRGQPIFYLSSLLLALLVGSMLISCEVANLTPVRKPPVLNPLPPLGRLPLSGARTPELRNRVFKSSLRELRERGYPEDQIVEALGRKNIEWQCATCTSCNFIDTNLCEVCGELRPVDPAIEWVCKACTFINPLPPHIWANKICEACGTDAHKYTGSTKNFRQEEKKKEECPICFEEDKFQKDGQHLCSQCKKAICKPCYQVILKGNNKACPLCRNEKY